MSNSKQNNEADPILNAALTIAARIELGRQTQSHTNGNIVPFPKGLRGADILEHLNGKERAKVD